MSNDNILQFSAEQQRRLVKILALESAQDRPQHARAFWANTDMTPAEIDHILCNIPVETIEASWDQSISRVHGSASDTKVYVCQADNEQQAAEAESSGSWAESISRVHAEKANSE